MRITCNYPAITSSLPSFEQGGPNPLVWRPAEDLRLQDFIRPRVESERIPQLMWQGSPPGWFWICETWKLGSIGAWWKYIRFTADAMSKSSADSKEMSMPSFRPRKNPFRCSVLGPTIAATDAIPMGSLGPGSPSPCDCGGEQRVAQCWECRRDVGNWGEWVPKLSALSHPSEELLSTSMNRVLPEKKNTNLFEAWGLA